jgi:hypothetical protein
MPPFAFVARDITSAVDATVVGVEPEGGVRIRVNRVVAGEEPPEVIRGARLTCLGVDLTARLQPGGRYVLLLHGESLYEEGTFYEVRGTKSGDACECWDGSPELQRRWMPLDEFARRLAEARRAR